MSDRIDPWSRPVPAGPWPPAGEDRSHDRGRRWCVQRDAHLDENDGHHGDAHIPAGECRTTEYYLDHIPATTNTTNTAGTTVTVNTDASGGTGDTVNEVSSDDGECGLSVYGASRFRSVQPRPPVTAALPSSIRATSGERAPYVVLETWADTAAPGEAGAPWGDQWATTQVRVRLALGEALRLARILTQLVDTVSPSPDGS